MGKDWQLHSCPKTKCVGSFAYMAPEVVAGDGDGRDEVPYAGAPVDVWSLGVMLYVMVVCTYPFGGVSGNDALRFKEMDDIRRNILMAEHKTSQPQFFPSGMSAALQELIRGMLTTDVTRRCTVEQVLGHPWLQGHGAACAQHQQQHQQQAGGCEVEMEPTMEDIDWSLAPPYQGSHGSDDHRVFESDDDQDDMWE